MILEGHLDSGRDRHGLVLEHNRPLHRVIDAIPDTRRGPFGRHGRTQIDLDVGFRLEDTVRPIGGDGKLGEADKG
jgi:hypothetical protein